MEGVEPRGVGADELAASTRRLENTFSPGRTWPDGAAMHSYEVTELLHDLLTDAAACLMFNAPRLSMRRIGPGIRCISIT